MVHLITNRTIGRYLRRTDQLAYGVWCAMLDNKQNGSDDYSLNSLTKELSIRLKTIQEKTSILIDYGLVKVVNGNYDVFQTPQSHAKKDISTFKK